MTEPLLNSWQNCPNIKSIQPLTTGQGIIDQSAFDTHNLNLVNQFVRNSVGLLKQVELANDAPTYKLIEGISRVSHADRVAKKIGFSKKDIDNYLAGSK